LSLRAEGGRTFRPERSNLHLASGDMGCHNVEEFHE
jgi:hypothetical protein